MMHFTAVRVGLTGLVVALVIVPGISFAVPVTGGTGPGGMGLTDGSSALEAWYKADTISQANNSTVNSWTDSSGNGRTATLNSGTPQFNTNQLNTIMPAVFFNSSAQLQFSALALPDFSIFGVARATGDRYLLQDPINRQVRFYQGGSSVLAAYNGNNPLSSTLATGPGSFLIGEYQGDSVSDQIAFFEQGQARGTGTFTNGFDSLSRIGTDAGSGSSISTAEIVIFSSRLNGTQRVLVENALSSKYNVLMLANNKYSGDNPGFERDFGVFGVGSDGTNSVLSSGHEGLGIEVGSLGTDDWVLAGHDNGSNGVTTTDMPGSIGRWERTWYIDTTDVGTANLAFDWQDAQNSATFNSQFKGLYYRAIDSGLFTLVATGVVDVGQQRVDFTGVSLIDGIYTLGVVPPVPEPSTVALVGLGLLGLAARIRRRRAAALAVDSVCRTGS